MIVSIALCLCLYALQMLFTCCIFRYNLLRCSALSPSSMWIFSPFSLLYISLASSLVQLHLICFQRFDWFMRHGIVFEYYYSPCKWWWHGSVCLGFVLGYLTYVNINAWKSSSGRCIPRAMDVIQFHLCACVFVLFQPETWHIYNMLMFFWPLLGRWFIIVYSRENLIVHDETS